MQMSFLKLISAAGLLVGLSSAAYAELIICNKTSWTQSVSIGYSENSNWVSKGWW